MFIQKIILDSAVKWQMGFQDPATPIMEGIIDLHHHIFFFLIVISFFVFWMTGFILVHFSERYTRFVEPTSRSLKVLWFRVRLAMFKRNTGRKVYNYLRTMYVVHGTTLELVWTIVPTFILLAIAVPSFSLLYSIDEVIDPLMTVKIIGHQWYWSYELSDLSLRHITMLGEFEGVNFDSYMLPVDELDMGGLRLLEVDNFVVFPTRVHIRLLITSADVIHCWSVPSLGVKVDAVPGRLNQASVYVKRPGVFFGQCSELCGVDHGFMPICVMAVDNISDFAAWLREN